VPTALAGGGAKDDGGDGAAAAAAANASWGRHLLRLVGASWPAGVALLDAHSSGGVCFRSTFALGGGLVDVAPSALGADNPFWAAAGIVRTPRVSPPPPAPGVAGGGRAHAAACAAARYTVLNRADARRLPEAATVADGISVLTSVAGGGGGDGDGDGGGAPAVTVATFDGAPRTPFSAQRTLLAATTTLVAAHGAGLANLLFLRPGSTVIEVFPFGYTPRIFAELAAQLGVVHVGVMAAPDEAGVDACLTTAHGGAGASRDVVVGLPVLLAKWHARAGGWKALLSPPETALQGLMPAAADPLGWHGLTATAPALASVRPCLRAQPLAVRPEALAMAAVSAAGCRKG